MTRDFLSIQMPLLSAFAVVWLTGCASNEAPGPAPRDASSEASVLDGGTVDADADASPMCKAVGDSCWDPEGQVADSNLCCSGSCIQEAFDQGATCAEP